jgi:hypothetical protein
MGVDALPEDEQDEKNDTKNQHRDDVWRFPAVVGSKTVDLLAFVLKPEVGTTYVIAAVKIPVPNIVSNVPTKSKVLTNVKNLSLSGCSSGYASTLGIVQKAMTARIAQIIAIRINDARQSNILAATPLRILPKTKPSGLPAPNAEKAIFFRLDGFPYAAPMIPIAGGTTMAVLMPMIPQMTSIQYGFCAKATIKEKALNETMPMMKVAFRPSRSAICPSPNWNAPAVRAVDAVIQLISPCVMASSRPMDTVIMELAPWKKELAAVALVAWKTKAIS